MQFIYVNNAMFFVNNRSAIYSMLNIFIPHRWNTDDYKCISELIDCTKYTIRDYSVPSTDSLPKIDGRYNVDPQIALKIKYSSLIVCSNRPALSGEMAIDEIDYALSLNKPIVAAKLVQHNNTLLIENGIEIIPARKDFLEAWIKQHVN